MSAPTAFEPFARALVAALGFGVVGSALLAASVWLWIRAFSPNATTRHALWWIALGASALLPVACLSGSLTRIEHRPAVTTPSKPSYADTSHPNTLRLSASRPNTSRPSTFRPNTSRPNAFRPAFRPSASRPNGLAGSSTSGPAQPRLREMFWFIARLATQPSFDLACAVLWLVVLLGRAAALVRRLAALQTLKAAAPALDETIVRRLRRWRHGCHTARSATLRVSDAVDVPVAVGFRRPAILLPVQVAQAQSAADLDQIALHEHAHLNRYDDWTNLAERALSCGLWFNPVVSFILRRISLEREIACDDRVIAQTGRAHRYAACLWKLVRTSRLPAPPIPAPGALLTSQQIATRIERLLDARRNALPRLSPAAAMFVALLGIGVIVLQEQHAPAIAVTEPQPLNPSRPEPAPIAPGRLASPAAAPSSAPVVPSSASAPASSLLAPSSWASAVPSGFPAEATPSARTTRAAAPSRSSKLIKSDMPPADVNRTVHEAPARAYVNGTIKDALRRVNVNRTVNDTLPRANVDRTVSDALRRANVDRTVNDALRRANVDRAVNDALRRANVDRTVSDALRRANVDRTVSDALRRANVDRTVSDALRRANIDRTISDALRRANVDRTVNKALAQADVATRAADSAVGANVAQSLRTSLSQAGAAPPNGAQTSQGEYPLIRDLPRFRRIVFETGIRVEVRHSARSRIDFGGAAYEARHTTTEVDGDTLTIGGRGSWTDEEPSEVVTIETPSLDGVDVDGSSSVVIDDVRADRLTLTMNGSGSIVVGSGFAPSATVEDAGSGTIDLVHLRTNALSASVEGSGDVMLSAPRALTLEIDGSGSIEVRGHAQALASQINGSGHIVQE